MIALVPGLEQTSFFLAGLTVTLAVLFHYLPDVTRRDLFFAVTVDPAFRSGGEARQILRQFRIATWLNSAIAIGIIFAGNAAENEWIPLVGVLWQVATMLPAFLRARRQTMPHAVAPTMHREASLAPRSAGGIGFALLELGPFAILSGCALYLRANWQRIPERFPVHWGLNGQPNGWATRSISGVYAPLFMGAIICALLAGLSYAIVVFTRHIWAAGPDSRAESRFRHAQLGVLLVIEYFVAATLCGVPLLALRENVNEMPGVGTIIVGGFILVLAIIAVLVYTGQGGARLAKSAVGGNAEKAAAVVGDRTPDQCWKAGMFYVNPDDPALLVEKRFGIGYTLNFGRPAAWLLLGGILAVAAVTAVFGILSARPH